MSWTLYDELIEGIPQDVQIKDYCLGLCWSYVEAESGMGVSYTCRGGATESTDARDFCGLPLKELAKLSKSWRFEEATLGIAALNAWYGRKDILDEMGAVYDEASADGRKSKGSDAFEYMRPRIESLGDARVCVVGHFPNVDLIEEYADVIVLERNCRSALDTPDSACEFVLPYADFAFITGVTLENKTAPRLLELSEGAFVSMVGPSVVMAPPLFEAGVDLAAGSIVIDPERAKRSVMSGSAMSFGGALQRTLIEA